MYTYGKILLIVKSRQLGIWGRIRLVFHLLGMFENFDIFIL